MTTFRRPFSIIAACSAVVWLTPLPATGQQADGSASGTELSPSARYRVEPTRVDEGPVIDGHLDDNVWQNAAIIDEFVQQEPIEGEPATERTVVRLLYDAVNLYVGVEALSLIHI